MVSMLTGSPLALATTPRTCCGIPVTLLAARPDSWCEATVQVAGGEGVQNSVRSPGAMPRSWS